jgi:hypothetical protein
MGDSAVWSQTQRRRTSEIGSLIERLKALEPGGYPAIATSRSAPTAQRCPDLLHWFGVGFASAWISGGVSLFALLFVHPAKAMPRLDVQSGVTSEASSALDRRMLWWKLPLSIDRAEPKVALRD